MATGASGSLNMAIGPIWLLYIWPLETYGYLRMKKKEVPKTDVKGGVALQKFVYISLQKIQSQLYSIHTNMGL